jgi:hypothetical protein
MSARFRRPRDRGFEPMFITVVKPHYRLDTEGRFHLVTRKGEFVFAGDRIAEKAGLEAAIQGLRDKLERKSSKNKTRRVLRLFSGAGAVGA